MVNICSVPERHPLHEVLALQDGAHPNIISFMDYYQETSGSKWLVLEYMRGDWLNNVVARNYLEEDHVARITADVCASHCWHALLELDTEFFHAFLGMRWVVFSPRFRPHHANGQDRGHFSNPNRRSETVYAFFL